MKPHQLLDACARSPAIREAYVALAEESVTRLDADRAGRSEGGQVRDDVDDRAVATLLLAAIIGVQTMNELRMKVDFPDGRSRRCACSRRRRACERLSFGLEAVADARLGEEEARPRGVGLELAAEVADVDVEVLLLVSRSAGPRPPSGAAGSVMTVPALRTSVARSLYSIGREADFAPPARHDAVAEIDSQVADA